MTLSRVKCISKESNIPKDPPFLKQGSTQSESMPFADKRAKNPETGATETQIQTI